MNTEITLKYFVYVRRSSEDAKERQAASIPEQKFELDKLRERYNLNIVRTFEESKTAFKPGRPIFNEMLDSIRDGDANAIIIWHENRLSRNSVDAGQIIYLMDEEKLAEVRTPSRIYRNLPSDKFMLQLELANSKRDSDDKAIVVTRGLEKKCRDGWRPGVAPTGYLPEKYAESGFRKVLIDTERLPFIKKIFELFHSGTSVVEIHRMAEKDWHYKTLQRKRSGGRPLSFSMIYHILSNSFYCGKFEYPIGSNNWYEGKHEKAISPEIFEEIQIKLGRKSQYHFKHQNYTYTAAMRCGYCGSGIVAEQKWQCICSICKLKFSLSRKNSEKCTGCNTLISEMDNPTILHYIYYRCGRKKNPACRQRGLRIDLLENQIDEKISQIDISPQFLQWAIKQINKSHTSERNFREDTIKSIKRSYDGVRIKLDNLFQLKISPENYDGNLLSDEKYKIEKNKLEVELKDVEKQLVNIDERMIQAHNDSIKAFNFAAKARERFATTKDLKVKREIFLGLAGSHLTLLDKTVHFDSPKYLFTIKKMKEEAPIIAERVAPIEQSVLTTEMEALYASIPTLLRGRESRPT